MSRMMRRWEGEEKEGFLIAINNAADSISLH